MSQEEVNLMAFVQDVRRELRDIPELKTLSVWICRKRFLNRRRPRPVRRLVLVWVRSYR